MGDFIKDLNIIDFLGMLLPGAFVALCLSIQHPGAWQILETAIGCELSLSLRITVVLVVGYVIGMLLHELGDRLEKCLWLVPVLNPRLYAARTTKLWKQEAEQVNATVKWDQAGSHKFRDTVELAWKEWKMCVFSPLLAAAVIAVLLMAAHMLPLGWGAILAIALGAVLCAANVYMLRDRFQVDAGGEGYTIKAMRRVLGGDAEYYSHAKQDKESQRKRNLFDGFRSSARNLFLAFIFLHAYTSAGEGELGSLIQTQMAKLPVRCVVYGAMLLMLIRYWYYSYLKFKYCYEDNVFERNRTQDAVTESAASK